MGRWRQRKFDKNGNQEVYMSRDDANSCGSCGMEADIENNARRRKKRRNNEVASVTDSGNSYVNVDVYIDSDHKAKVRSDVDFDKKEDQEQDQEQEKDRKKRKKHY